MTGRLSTGRAALLALMLGPVIALASAGEPPLEATAAEAVEYFGNLQATWAQLTMAALTLGMMARTACGHTGRPIEASRLMTAAFAIINLAAVVRVFGPVAFPDAHPLIGVSALLWALAFLLYLIEFSPILTSARIDGRPG